MSGHGARWDNWGQAGVERGLRGGAGLGWADGAGDLQAMMPMMAARMRMQQSQYCGGGSDRIKP